MSSQLPQATATRMYRLTIYFATLVLVTSCIQSHSGSVRKIPLGNGSPDNPWVVTVIFNPDDQCNIIDTVADSTTCSSGSGFCVHRGHKIRWQSDTTGFEFQLFFDPFQGRPFTSHNDKLEIVIDRDAPIADYKYSIVGVGCSATKAHTHDPRIRVDT